MSDRSGFVDKTIDDLAKQITLKVIEELEQGIVPWHRLLRMRDATPRKFPIRPGEWSLCAELSAHFLASALGMGPGPPPPSPELVANWIDILRFDHTAIIRIAHAAWRTVEQTLSLLPESHSTPPNLVNGQTTPTTH